MNSKKKKDKYHFTYLKTSLTPHIYINNIYKYNKSIKKIIISCTVKYNNFHKLINHSLN